MYDKQHIIKRKGHKEYFDIRKLYGSIYAACMTLRMHHEEAELLANMVSSEIEKKLADKKEITTKQLREIAATELEKYHPDATYMYRNHKDIY